jgi:superfamily I DNA/RNA helicase
LKLLAQTSAIEAILAEEGLAPTEIVPLLTFVGRRNMAAQLGRVVVSGERDLPRDLTRRGLRLDGPQVERLVRALDRACAPRTKTEPTAKPGQFHAEPKPGAQYALLSEDDIVAALREAACLQPIESWMTWLHPRQARFVAQRWNGPARIRGAAGTGKTVVALHRAKRLAAEGKRVLFTSFVRTLPTVHAQLFDRLAPDVPGSVEFIGIHAWANRLLAARGVHLDYNGADTCFNRAWSRVGRSSVLSDLNVPLSYWHEEVCDVVKSRSLTSYGDYAALRRVGRKLPLQPNQREAVWALYQEYEELLLERGVHDWADLLTLTLQSITANPVTPSYDAVIVDEVQDLTCVGVRLLHALVGDTPDGLLLVGDGQQAVYPGGFNLSEAGVSVVGRARVLDRNYRNGSQILRAALEIVATDDYDDLDSDPIAGARQVALERDGGTVIRSTFAEPASQQRGLLEQIKQDQVRGTRLGDMAVLCSTNNEVMRWLRYLGTAGIAALDLAAYDGRTIDVVKVGTYQRAKGLEFANVLIPDHTRVPLPQRSDESADAYTERASLERRRLFVAMTRARDLLWLG